MKNSNKIKLIYILGTSYSGSTLLGYFLSKNFDIYNLGELKFYNRIHSYNNLKCSCGNGIYECKFWKKFWGKYKNIFERPSRIKRVFIAVRLIVGSKLIQKRKSITDDDLLLNCIKKILSITMRAPFIY